MKTIQWEVYSEMLEHGLRPPMASTITIIPKDSQVGAVIYVGVPAFTCGAPISDDDLRELAKTIGEKLNR